MKFAKLRCLSVFALLCGLAAWGFSLRSREASTTTSNRLKQTEIVATFDATIPPKKSAIWCATIELAWNKVRELNGGSPLDLEGAEDLCRSVNQATPESDIDPDSFLAMAGWTDQGIVTAIQKEMNIRFPNAKLPPLSPHNGNDILAFSYLQVAIRFPIPYADRDGWFVDADGNGSRVSGFGTPRTLDGEALKASRQLRVLFYKIDDKAGQANYALDLHSESKPYQIVAACIPRQKSLKDAFDFVRRSENESEMGSKGPRGTSIAWDEFFCLPRMDWNLDFEIEQMIDRKILSGPLAGGHIARAIQSINFRLEKGGVFLESRAQFDGKKDQPREFTFDQPYLLYMIRRGSSRPFFAMWVDNAELLIKN